MGLTSEEEESQGVAASLLGPLIPSEVKEAEEKWRKTLIQKSDEPENSLDSDGEGTGPVGSPASNQQDPETAPTLKKNLSIKKQLAETQDAEEEAEEDTMELELALERKKVEICHFYFLTGFTFKLSVLCYFNLCGKRYHQYGLTQLIVCFLGGTASSGGGRRKRWGIQSLL